MRYELYRKSRADMYRFLYESEDLEDVRARLFALREAQGAQYVLLDHEGDPPVAVYPCPTPEAAAKPTDYHDIILNCKLDKRLDHDAKNGDGSWDDWFFSHYDEAAAAAEQETAAILERWKQR